MIHPNTRIKFINPQMGYGIFATELIPKGAITYIADPLETRIYPNFFNQLSTEMQEEVEKYSYVDNQGVYVVSWDLAKYVNHSCNPNSMSTGYGFEIALRDIRPGEQLTDEYALFNSRFDMICACGSKRCRGLISSSDLDKNHLKWDRKVKSAFSRFFDNDQPLMGLISPDTVKDLNGYFSKIKSYKSILELKYPPVGESVTPPDTRKTVVKAA